MEWQELTATAGILVGGGFLLKYLVNDMAGNLNRIENILIKLIDSVNSLKDYVKEKIK